MSSWALSCWSVFTRAAVARTIPSDSANRVVLVKDGELRGGEEES
eukprot:CAMPEP_0175854708 /NCGR_PEP_ID=MMETSP0107_2-20121207/27512_1 /TAXON_ID=195067 ORGANISM="Goniomonas pacifica, Strain CCMP1869" /NCGR_SAMPLE_ID=MMETSP0107_2 /ASSEMBLY_ACC=CAM_ASM_000203 /LENGTH=44 /DNA_ID= /DNA_START= /DNA_END= /DNA_ORIENTATION=